MSCCGTNDAVANQAEIVLVGCGCPNRGMGWYHAIQLLEGRVKHGKLVAVVEPWFLGGGADSEQGVAFKAWADSVPSVTFHASLSDVPPPAEGKSRMALISGRTADNPRLLTECIAHRCTTIYLEKPGAPTVKELETMKQEVAAANVSVKMGYNKNVCKYVSKVRDFASAHEGSHVTFVSNNTYDPTPASLGECFERNCEGMLKNMAIHELALLVSFYDVTVSNVSSVTVDKSFTSRQTLPGPSGKDYTDFDKIKFTVTTKNGKKVSVAADRCGGDVSYATVTNPSGDEVFRWSMPDSDDKASVKALEEKHPDAMPYFFSQDPDYVLVKDRVAAFACGAKQEAEGVADIEVAVETLKLAEWLVDEVAGQL